MRVAVLSIILNLGLNLGGLALAQESAAAPPSSAEGTEVAQMYLNHCAHCHGEEGRGGRGPSLRKRRLRQADSDEDLARIIKSGIPGSIMPSNYYDEKQLALMVAYVRTFGAQSEQAVLAGDATSGEALFFGDGGCGQCHMVGGKGGRTGPDLSEAGAVRSAAHLRESIVDPGAEVEPRLYAVRAVTKAGEKLYGRRLNIGTFTVQLLEASRGLVSVAKSDLESFEIVKESMMPPYSGVLSTGQVDDLVAYLASLGREESSK